MRGMANSRTLVRKYMIWYPPPPPPHSSYLGMNRVKELDDNLNSAMYLLMSKSFIFFSYQTIFIK